MLKRLIIVLLILIPTQVFGYDLWNKIDNSEYPDDVLIEANDKTQEQVISGSIEKNIDMTLENCIQIALGNNPEINAAFQDILVADTKIRQIWSNYFPVISWQTSWSHIKQLQLSDALSRNLEYEYYLLGQISLQQLLYDFGVTQNQATIQRLGYEANKKTFAGVINDIIYRTKIAYFKLQFAYESEKVAQNTVEKYQEFYEEAKALYQIGLNPKVDVTIALANLSSAKIQLIQAKNNVNTSIAELNNIMGVPYLEKYKINENLEYNPLDIEFEKAISIADHARPELKLAQIEVERARQNIKLAKKSFLPIIDAEGQYQRGGKHWTSNDGWNIGIYLNFTRLNARLIANQIREARFLYDKELARAKQVQNNVYLEIQTAFLKLNEKKNQIPVSKIQVKQAQENYDLSNGRYSVGEASPIELKEAENTLRNSKLTYYNALYEYNCARAELEKSIGQNLPPSGEIIELKK